MFACIAEKPGWLLSRYTEDSPIPPVVPIVPSAYTSNPISRSFSHVTFRRRQKSQQYHNRRVHIYNKCML